MTLKELSDNLILGESVEVINENGDTFIITGNF